MNYVRYLLIIILIVLALAGAYLAYHKNDNQNSIPTPSNELLTYSSDAFNISFAYPRKYYLEEKNLSTPQRYHYILILTEDTEENRQVREGVGPPREGPVAITIDLYQNDLDNMAALQWVQGTNDSNFKLSDGTYRMTRLGGIEAVAYKWSGLYEADNYVAATNNYIYSLAVTYISPEEQIRKDFEELRKSVQFTD